MEQTSLSGATRIADSGVLTDIHGIIAGLSQSVDAAELKVAPPADPAPVVATIGKIIQIDVIPGAERIQQATADCGIQGQWTGVVGKDLNAGDKVLVLLQDALLPPDDRWAFMEKRGWRVRMARFMGAVSECVILPLRPQEITIDAGSDVGELLGIKKFSKPIPVQMAGQAKGNFPSFIPKTDEPNFQRVKFQELMRQAPGWVATVKYDGTSCTAYTKDGELHVCSRNWELKPGDSVYWKMAEKYDLKRIPEGMALQFEIIGPDIQGNPLGLKEHEIRVFTVYVFDEGATGLERGRQTHFQLCEVCLDLGLPRASTAVAPQEGARDADQLRDMAEIRYPNGRPTEGIVVRATDASFSFKVINLSYRD